MGSVQQEVGDGNVDVHVLHDLPRQLAHAGLSTCKKTHWLEGQYRSDCLHHKRALSVCMDTINLFKQPRHEPIASIVTKQKSSPPLSMTSALAHVGSMRPMEGVIHC